MPEERPSPEMLLEYLYGLLEPSEANRVRNWLETGDGAAARADAERAKNLFATAAKLSFSEVKFERPTIVPPTTSWRNRRPWTAWVVAAAVLVAAAIPFGWHEIRERECTRESATIQRQLEAKQYELRDVQAQRLALVRAAEERATEARAGLARQQSEFVAAEHKLTDDLQQKQLSLVISGPGTILPGGPNDFHIRALDGRNQPTNATVIARLKDGKENQLYEQVLGQKFGDFDLRLPPDLTLTQSDVVLEVSALGEAGSKSTIREQLPLALPQLLTHLTTDKPLYRPCETVRFRSLTLDRLSLKPSPDELQLEFIVIDPDQVQRSIVRGPTLLVHGNSLVLGPDKKPVRGIGCGEWLIPDDAPDGEYALVVRELNGRFPSSERRFKINRYKPERLLKELAWSRQSYGPGEPVVANCIVRTVAGPVVGQPVSASVVVDGDAVPIESVPLTDNAGRVAIRFRLPDKIERGEAKLRVEFRNGTVHESLSRSVPIALKKLEIDFFPEGGDLVAGTPNRVYFQAHTTLGKPADIEGRIVDNSGRTVARAVTLTDDREVGVNQGMGRFEFVPNLKQQYRLIVDKPAGIESKFALPESRESGVVLTAFDEVNPEPGPLRVRVASVGVERPLLVGAYSRGRMIDHRRVVLPANQSADIELKPEMGFGGITRVTVFEERSGPGQRPSLVPAAERLVYRRPTPALNLSLKADRATYTPGETVHYKVSAADEAQKSAAAVLYFAVVNESVTTMADDKTDRSLPTHFLLTAEVGQPEELEHADVLLGTHPKAAAALDLLLGIQGWRRFKEVLPNKPAGAATNPDRILLAMSVAADDRAKGKDLERENRPVTDEIRLGIEAAKQKVTETETVVGRLKAETAAADADKLVNDELAALNARYRDVESNRARLDDLWRESQRRLLPVLCTLGLALASLWAVVGILRGWNWRIPAAASLTVAVVAAVMLTINLFDSAARAPEDRLSAENAPHAQATPDWKSPAGRAGFPGGERDGSKSELESQSKSEQLSRRIAPGAPKSAAPVAAPAPATSPAPSPATPAPTVLEKDVGDAGRSLKKVESKADGAANEHRKSAESGPFGGGGGGKLPARKADPDQLDKTDIKPDQAKSATGGRGMTPQVMPPPAPPGSAGAGRPGGGQVVGETLKPRDEPESRLRLTQPLVVREYAHHRSERTRSGADFAETLFWHPVLVVPTTGAEVTFDLADDIVGYRVIAAGHTLDGRLGSVTTRIQVQPAEHKEADKARDPAKP